MKVKLYIEGGGSGPVQDTLFRAGWAAFFEKAGLGKIRKMPSTFRGGSREQTFDAYKRAVQTRRPDELPILLVDSEDILVDGLSGWDHLAARDGWQRPRGAGDEDAFLMVACMEAWFVADREALSKFFVDCWRAKALPQWPDLERVEKGNLLQALARATNDGAVKRYSKGRTSFELLKVIDPGIVQQRCPSARKLIERLRNS